MRLFKCVEEQVGMDMDFLEAAMFMIDSLPT